MAGSSTPRAPSLRGTRLFLTVFVGFLVLLSVGRLAVSAYVEILWQAQTGYSSAFWTRIAWEWGARIAGGLVVGTLVFVNLKIASTTLGGIQIKRRFGNLEISEQIPRRYVTWAMLTMAVLLGSWFGGAFPADIGRSLLFLANAEPWGLVEPVLGHDVGFYVFVLPLLNSGSVLALIVVFLLFTLATAGYAATGALSWARGRVGAHDVARRHLGILLALFFGLLALRLWLGRYMLLVDGSSGVQSIFGYTDGQARLPALQTLAVISVAAGAGCVWGALRNRAGTVVSSIGAVVLGSLLIGEFYPALVQNFQVEPNELERESPYIEHNLSFTRVAFGLSPEHLERRSFEYRPEEPLDWMEVAEQLPGLPIWNPEPLLTTYQELEARRPYYDFLDVTIDRYPGPQGPVPVAISVREIDPSGIQDQRWQNLHLRELYVAGMGAVVSLATASSAEGRPEAVVTGIPPEVVTTSTEGQGLDLDLTRPKVFFGTGIQQRYAVVTPGPEEHRAPDGGPGVAGVDYPLGIELRSKIRTGMLAWIFRDATLFFASELTSDSRLIFRRLVHQRAAAVAPFLMFPETPYPVIHDGRLVWLLEGFTGSASFPLASPGSFGDFRAAELRYLRNSIKVTVDAVTGAVELYRVPIDDPLADVYARAFPGLIQPISEMPAGLREHVRYSKAMLDVQVRLLLQYHQETAAAFHGQQDVWDEPQELAENTTPVPYLPEYAIFRLPGETEKRYQLSTVFVPAGRQNLTAMLVARTDEMGAPELILLDLPLADQTSAAGPRQIEAQVEQNPQISEQFSLWRTGGSQVWTGHLHLIPVGHRFFYMEPVFLAAETDAIPELRRFVVSDGTRAVMSESLADAVGQLAGSAAAALSPDVSDRATVLDPGTAAPRWPTAALDLLEEAESRAREGDWQGFGEALDRLRELLQRLETGGG